MIKHIVNLLKLHDWHGESELIEQAKGRYELPSSFKEARKLIKRKRAWQLSKK